MTMHRTRKVALVTGASRGIGAAVARRLAADGMAVAVNSYPDERMLATADELVAGIRRDGGEALVLPADIADGDAVDGMFTRCEAGLGEVDALVLNATWMQKRKWTDVTEADWDAATGVNLKGAWLCCRRAFGTRNSSGGAIVTISSVQARIGVAGSLLYDTTKAGVIGFTRTLARELGPAGVRVNCVMPGAILTETELELFPDQAAVQRKMSEVQALQRRGKPEDIAGAVSFLVGPDSAFITGQTVCVDGGWVPL